MLRAVASKMNTVLRGSMGLTASRMSAVGAVRMAHDSGETDEQFDKRYVDYFSRCDIDGWEVRKGMNDLLGMDLVPDPQIIIAALRACRRVNDYALAVRWLEGVKDKCGDKKAEIYPYLLSEIKSTLTELGVSTPEEMGYDCPELALKSVFDL